MSLPDIFSIYSYSILPVLQFTFVTHDGKCFRTYKVTVHLDTFLIDAGTNKSAINNIIMYRLTLLLYS